MGRYTIWKDGQQIESSMAQVELDYMKKRLKELNGNVLHIISGDATDIYKRVGDKVHFSHTYTREG